MSVLYISEEDKKRTEAVCERLRHYFHGRLEIIHSYDTDKINAYGTCDGQLKFVAGITCRMWDWGTYPNVMVSEHHINTLLGFRNKCELVMFVVATTDGSIHTLDIGRIDMTQFPRAYTGRISNPRPGEANPLEWMRLPPPYVFQLLNEPVLV